MSETQTNDIQTDQNQSCEPKPPDFVEALNSVMDNIENVVVNFQKILSIVLERIEKLESSETTRRSDMPFDEKGLGTEEIKEIAPNAVASTKESLEDTSGAPSDAETSTKADAELRQSQGEVPQSLPSRGIAGAKKSIVSKTSALLGIFGRRIFKKAYLRSNYLILAVAIVALGIAIVKIYFTLFA